MMLILCWPGVIGLVILPNYPLQICTDGKCPLTVLNRKRDDYSSSSHVCMYVFMLLY